MVRKMLILCVLALLAKSIVMIKDTVAQPPDSSDLYAAATLYVKDYLTKLRNEDVALFYAECSLKTGKSSLIFPVGAKQGLYVEFTREGMVANTATVTWAGKTWHIDVDQGGLYTIKRATDIAQKLLTSAFTLLRTTQEERIWMVAHKSTPSCPLPPD